MPVQILENAAEACVCVARNHSTAAVYDKLGLPQYHGIEAFKRYRPV